MPFGQDYEWSNSGTQTYGRESFAFEHLSPARWRRLALKPSRSGIDALTTWVVASAYPDRVCTPVVRSHAFEQQENNKNVSARGRL